MKRQGVLAFLLLFVPASIVLASYTSTVAPAQPVELTDTPLPAYLPVILKDFPEPTVTPTPTATLSPYSFTLQPGSPAHIPNIANSQGCNWFGVSGRVFDLSHREVIGLVVWVEGGGLSVDTLTGSQPKYGPSGWEVALGNAPVATTDVYRVQLRDAYAQILSEWVVFPTYADCNKNQVLINFVQNH